MNKNRRVSSIFPNLWLIISMLSFVFTGPAETPAEPRGEIRVVENWRPDISVLGYNVLQYLFEYAIDKNELAPCLAVSREWIDDTTLEIRLRKGVRFHNGEPFDANAVKFNFDYQRQHNPGRGVQVYMRHLNKIQVIHPLTVRFIFDEPDTLMLDRTVLGPISGWVIGAPKYMEQVGWADFLKRPIGTGPYMVDGAVKDYRRVREGEVYATLIANANHWKRGYPKIQKISFVQYSPQGAVNALTEGRVDLVTSLVPKDTLKVEKSPFSKVVKGRNDMRWTVGFMNQMSPNTFPLRNLLVRKALNHAVNKQELLKYAFKGNAMEMKGVLTEMSGVDLNDTRVYEWDIPKARELMKEAGYKDGFKMKLYYHDRDFLLARLLQRFYSLLKIETDIEAMDWEWFVRHTVYPNTHEGYSWENEDWWVTIHSHPTHVPEVMGGWFEWAFHSGAPWQTFPDYFMLPLNKMYDEVLRTKEHDKRFLIYKKANEYIAGQAFWIFTMATLGLYGVNEDVEFVPHISQYLYLDYSSVTDRHWSMRGKNN